LHADVTLGSQARPVFSVGTLIATLAAVNIFGADAFDQHEHVSFFVDREAGLKAIVAIHRTGPLGVAGGGCRLWPYADEQAALADALRLSRAMTWKLALVEIPIGGAKAVVIADPARGKSEALLTALGRAIDRLAGRFIASEDVGIGVEDLQVVARATRYVGPPVDTADAAAEGVLATLRRAVRRRLGRDELRDRSVAVQGLGRVGRNLCARLASEGVRLVVADLDPARVAETLGALPAVAVAPDAIFDQEVDVVAPCALGEVIDAERVQRLRCAVVAGSANHPLAGPEVADALAARDILYVPDLVASAGGVIGAASAGDAAARRARIAALGALAEEIFLRAQRDGVSTERAAEQLARERFRAMGGRP
jgi:leucine dehydrogenase